MLRKGVRIALMVGFVLACMFLGYIAGLIPAYVIDLRLYAYRFGRLPLWAEYLSGLPAAIAAGVLAFFLLRASRRRGRYLMPTFCLTSSMVARAMARQRAAPSSMSSRTRSGCAASSA